MNVLFQIKYKSSAARQRSFCYVLLHQMRILNALVEEFVKPD